MIRRDKTHFRWKDPSHNAKASLRALGRDTLKLLVIVILSSMTFLIILQWKYDIALEKPLAVLILIILFILTIYYIHARFAPYIILKDTYIYRGFNDETAEEWKYKDISRFKIIEDGVNRLLEIESKNRERSQVAIAQDVSIKELRAFLQAKGLNELRRPNQAL